MSLNKNNKILDAVKEIKRGNTFLRNQFIEQYKPFIFRCVSNAINYKFVDEKNNDEFSIGLIAFDEAINKFDENKGKNFLDFCQLVITRRIINYKIKEQKNNNVFPFTYFKNHNTDDNFNFEDKILGDFYSNERDEIIDFKSKLKEFRISMVELADNVPKHKDSKIMCIEIAKKVISNNRLYAKFLHKKSLPVNETALICGCSKRTIDRNKIFIISTIIILKSNLDVIKGFISNIYKEGNR